MTTWCARSTIALVSALVTACAARSATPTISASAATKPVSTPALEAIDGSHAPLYPILPRAQLLAITSSASAAAPGWKIAVDSLGGLMFATCNICSSRNASHAPGGGGFSAADHHLVEIFLQNEEALVHFNAPLVRAKNGNITGGVLFEQETPVGSSGAVWAHFGFVGKVEVVGSAWPRLPPTEGAKTDAELEPALRKLAPDPGLDLRRRFITVARNPDGPVELHHACCLETPFGAHACVDAFTVEDLTPLMVGLTATGIVTSRPATQ